MLKKLSIEQFVIIDKLELGFNPGLTVLTGETGAGKSILLDAMGLILGEPPEPASIRQGSDHAVIEALLAPPANNPVWKFLAEHELTPATPKEFSIRRTITPGGQDEILLGGKSVDLPVLKKIGTFLCEIHGQFANQSLLEPSNQLTLLDLSGSIPPAAFKNVADALHRVYRCRKDLEEESAFFAKHGHELIKTEKIVASFAALGMRTGFIEEVQADYARLLIARDTSEAFQSIIAQLVAANGAVKALSAANMVLERQKNFDAERMQDLRHYLATALENARAAVDETQELGPDYDIDTKPIRRYEQILAGLKKISEETLVKFDDLSRYYEDVSVKLERIRNGRAKIAKLSEQVQIAENNYRHHAHILTEKRIIAGKALSEAITAGLPPLKLMSAQFQVLVEEKSTNPWTELGLNTVTFMARMNPGQPFSPIADTASGGELARLILALKVVLQAVQTIPTLVFDEVDTGIGGAAAAAVGERIAHLAETTQVLVITHSPQVASRGDQHLHVTKKTDGVTTTSVVRMLTLDERTDEISRMLAGDTITPESHAAAKKLIEEAHNAAGVRRQNFQKIS